MFEKNMNISLLLDFYGDILSDRQKSMLDMYYNDDLSLSEISEYFSISRQGVRSVLKKSESILNEMEEKLHLAQKFTEFKTESYDIATSLLSLSDEIDNDDIKKRIYDIVNKISDLANKI